MKKINGFTLVEIMIVVAIIAILAAIAIPQLITSRKMARANECMNTLKLCNYATDQAALSLGVSSGEYVSATALTFIKGGNIFCPLGGEIVCWTVGEPASCSYHGTVTSPTPLSDLTD